MESRRLNKAIIFFLILSFLIFSYSVWTNVSLRNPLTYKEVENFPVYHPQKLMYCYGDFVYKYSESPNPAVCANNFSLFFHLTMFVSLVFLFFGILYLVIFYIRDKKLR